MERVIESKVSEFFSQFPLINYNKGKTILSAEENPKDVFFLKSGYVRMYSISEGGKELTMNIFKQNTYFPATWAIAKIPNFFFYETLTAAEISHVPNERFLNFIKKEPQVLFNLTERVLSGLNGTLVRMDYLISSDAYTRVAATLLMSGRRFGKRNAKGETQLQLPLTHKDIANLSGLTRESTTVEIGKMVKEGLITNKDKIFTITDMNALRDKSMLYFEDNALPYTF